MNVKVHLSNIKFYLLAVCVGVLVPLLPLMPSGYSLGDDWGSTYWITNYYLNYLKIYHQFPKVIHTDLVVGIPYPLFYGYFMFPLMSIMSLLFDDVKLGVRAVLFLLWSLQFFHCYGLFKRLGQDRFTSFVFACLISWAVYPLTNLFVRGAITETVAVAFLTCALCTWFRFLLARTIRSEWIFGSLTAVYLAFGFGTHPITFAFGGVFFGIVALISLSQWHTWKHKGRKVFGICLIAAAGLGMLSPWLFQLFDSGNHNRILVCEHIPTVDSFFGRYSPIPIPWGWLFPNLIGNRPGIDANTNTMMLVLLIAALISLRKLIKFNASWIAVFAALGLFLWASSISMGLNSNGMLAHIYGLAQFRFRFCTYINLSILVATVFLMIAAPQFKYRKQILITCLLIQGIAVGVKIYHGYAIRISSQFFNIDDFASNTKSLDEMGTGGWGMYCIKNLYPLSATMSDVPTVKFKVSRQTLEVLPLALDFRTRESAVVNVCAYPINNLQWKNQTILSNELQSSFLYPVVTLQGSSELHYKLHLQPEWYLLRWLSRLILATCLGILAILLLRSSRTRNRK